MLEQQLPFRLGKDKPDCLPSLRGNKDFLFCRVSTSLKTQLYLDPAGQRAQKLSPNYHGHVTCHSEFYKQWCAGAPGSFGAAQGKRMSNVVPSFPDVTQSRHTGWKTWVQCPPLPEGFWIYVCFWEEACIWNCSRDIRRGSWKLSFWQKSASGVFFSWVSSIVILDSHGETALPW